MIVPPSEAPHRRRRWPWYLAALLLLAVIAAGWWLGKSKSQEAQATRSPQAIPVVTAMAETRDVPVRLKANGTVTAIQSVEIRAQVTSTVREVHIREGQNVAKGDLLFSLDARADDANIHKAEAQVVKDKADLATAQRNLERQVDLFKQKFIAQAALDTAQNQVDTLKGQLGVDEAALESARVARGYSEIRAPFAGRTGTISVRAGSLVQPGTAAAVLVTITQIDPISVAFTLSENELPGLQQALAAGPVTVTATPQASGESLKGRVTFVDNSVDTASGTIRVKADFPNRDLKLWPGMFVNAELSPRTIRGATVVPTPAVQTGPEKRFVYVVGPEHKVEARDVKVPYIEESFAVVEGIAPDAKVVTEGAQNLRPGSVVAETDRADSSPRTAGKPGKGPGANPPKRNS